MRRIVVAVSLLASSLAGNALADGIGGRLGVFGKAGLAVPVQDDFISGTSKTKIAFITGGGLIYGITDSLAAEMDVSHAPSLDVETAGVKTFKGSLTDISLGVQYRFSPDKPVVPYLGIGADFITGELEHAVTGNKYDLEWTPGGHINAGVDYFITKGIALTADIRGIVAVKGDIKRGDSKVGNFDPASFQATFGVRLFLPSKL